MHGIKTLILLAQNLDDRLSFVLEIELAFGERRKGATII